MISGGLNAPIGGQCQPATGLKNGTMTPTDT